MFPLLLANSITADMGLIPGLALAGPAAGLPLSVMAAFIERPFVSRAGVGRLALAWSLEANFLSLFAGYAAVLAAAAVTDAMRNYAAFYTVVPFVAVACSIVVERLYLARRAGAGRVSWGWVSAGNVLSAAVCIGMIVLLTALRKAFPWLRYELRPYERPLTVFAGVGSLLTFAGAFAVTWRAGRRERSKL